MTKLKSKSNKIAKLKKDRFSLFTNDMNHCYFGKKPKDNIHEVIFGKNRINSIKYGLTLPLCIYYRRLMHSDTSLVNKWCRKGQAKFIEAYPGLKFENIFKINYFI